MGWKVRGVGVNRILRGPSHSTGSGSGRQQEPATAKTGNGNGKSWRGEIYIPTHRKVRAMDGAPFVLWRIRGDRQRQVRGGGWERVWVEKRISPLRGSRRDREPLRSK